MQRKFSVSLLILAGITGCSSSTGLSEGGVADVSGQVLQASNTPLAGARVAIVCSDGQITLKVPTDANGRYLTPLTISEAQMRATGGKVSCQFGAPDSINARIRAQAVVAFYAPGLPHPLQMVDLKESP